ncbi:MAG: sulfotransferase domain-containing protein [Candidatus Heimdallarchaeota archaeon]|nr:sulfotransferase domain-containing protein [Candidatus Heimdallarchaeota archaeon]
MVLDPSVNYIVSGIERSGTSMLMQILHNGGIPIGFDDDRPADMNNPKGYYELEGGKIINKLMEGSFPFDQYKGTFIKITAYGLKFLPQGNYKILYSERNIEEILDSMQKMAQIDDTNREETKQAFLKLNTFIKETIKQRSDCSVLFISYNDIIKNPQREINHIIKFLNIQPPHLNAMIRTVDDGLYRQRHATST